MPPLHRRETSLITILLAIVLFVFVLFISPFFFGFSSREDDDRKATFLATRWLQRFSSTSPATGTGNAHVQTPYSFILAYKRGLTARLVHQNNVVYFTFVDGTVSTAHNNDEYDDQKYQYQYQKSYPMSDMRFRRVVKSNDGYIIHSYSQEMNGDAVPEDDDDDFVDYMHDEEDYKAMVLASINRDRIVVDESDELAIRDLLERVAYEQSDSTSTSSTGATIVDKTTGIKASEVAGAAAPLERADGREDTTGSSSLSSWLSSKLFTRTQTATQLRSQRRILYDVRIVNALAKMHYELFEDDMLTFGSDKSGITIGPLPLYQAVTSAGAASSSEKSKTVSFLERWFYSKKNSEEEYTESKVVIERSLKQYLELLLQAERLQLQERMLDEEDRKRRIKPADRRSELHRYDIKSYYFPDYKYLAKLKQSHREKGGSKELVDFVEKEMNTKIIATKDLPIIKEYKPPSLAELKYRYSDSLRNDQAKLNLLRFMDRAYGHFLPLFYYNFVTYQQYYYQQAPVQQSSGNNRPGYASSHIMDLLNLKPLLGDDEGAADKSTHVRESTDAKLDVIVSSLEYKREKLFKFFSSLPEKRLEAMQRMATTLHELYPAITAAEGALPSMSLTTTIFSVMLGIELSDGWWTNMASSVVRTVRMTRNGRYLPVPSISLKTGHIIGEVSDFNFVFAAFPSWYHIYYRFVIHSLEPGIPVVSHYKATLLAKQEETNQYLLSVQQELIQRSNSSLSNSSSDRSSEKEDKQQQRRQPVDYVVRAMQHVKNHMLVPMLADVVKPVKILVFFATWHSHCKFDLPPLVKALKLADNPNVQVEYIAVEADRSINTDSHAGSDEEALLLDKIREENDLNAFFSGHTMRTTVGTAGFASLDRQPLRVSSHPYVAQYEVHSLPTFIVLAQNRYQRHEYLADFAKRSYLLDAELVRKKQESESPSSTSFWKSGSSQEEFNEDKEKQLIEEKKRVAAENLSREIDWVPIARFERHPVGGARFSFLHNVVDSLVHQGKYLFERDALSKMTAVERRSFYEEQDRGYLTRLIDKTKKIWGTRKDGRAWWKSDKTT